MNGCIVCESWCDQMLALPQYAARICRSCGETIGHVILDGGPLLVRELWGIAANEPETPRNDHLDAMLASFKGGVATETRLDDAQVHLDLAIAYGAMGLIADGVREAAIATSDQAAHTTAERAVNWLFEPRRASQRALQVIVRMARADR